MAFLRFVNFGFEVFKTIKIGIVYWFDKSTKLNQSFAAVIQSDNHNRCTAILL